MNKENPKLKVELVGTGDKNESQPPIIRCPNCGEVNKVDLGRFQNNMGAIYLNKCRSCGGDVFMAMILLSNNDLIKLNRHIEMLVDATKSAINGPQGNLIIPRR